MARKVIIRVKPWVKKPKKITITIKEAIERKKRNNQNFIEKHNENMQIQKKKKAKV